jgi:hypothetical protein
VYEAESRELADLQQYFALVDAENQRFAEELRTIQRARDEEVRVQRRRHDGAMLVQKLFAGFNEKVLAKRNKGKKKKKKE